MSHGIVSRQSIQTCNTGSSRVARLCNSEPERRCLLPLPHSPGDRPVRCEDNQVTPPPWINAAIRSVIWLGRAAGLAYAKTRWQYSTYVGPSCRRSAGSSTRVPRWFPTLDPRRRAAHGDGATGGASRLS